MSDSPLHLTLRDWRAGMSSRRTLVARAQLGAARREGDLAPLPQGPAIPASRTTIPQIKEAGLGPVRI